MRMREVVSLSSIFKVEKPIIGVVHLLPLPGSPMYRRNDKEILDRALRDARAYCDGGIDGIIIENFGDAPYYPDRVGPETVASMARIASRIVEEVDIPIGISVLRNDAISAIAIAHAVGAKFIRVNVLTEAMVTDQGIIQSRAHEVLRYRSFLGAEGVKIFADLRVKHAAPLAARPIELSAEDLFHRSLADAIILTGPATGREVNFDDIHKVKRAVPAPVLVGSGVNRDNVAKYLEVCDGAIVGTSLKVGGIIENPVDVERVRELVKRARGQARVS